MRWTAGRGRLLAALAAILLGVAATLLLPQWWEHRLYRQTESLTGVGAKVLPGSAVEARKKVAPGMSQEKMLASLGRPSLAMNTAGSSTHGVSTYYYADGTMTVNLTDGMIVRISLDASPPKIPTSRRP